MFSAKRVRRLSRLLALCLIFALLPAAHAAAAEIDSLEVSFRREDHSISNENGEIELYYDLLQVPQSYPHRLQMDMVLAEEYFDYISSIQGLEMYLDMPDSHFCYVKHGDVPYNREGVLSLRYTMEWFMGGVSNWGWHGITFDLDTGKRVGMDDLLEMDAESIMERLRPVILAYAQANGGWEQSELEGIVSGYTLDDLDYCVESDGELVLCIPQYELGPGASGPMLIPTGLYYGSASEEEESLLDILLSPSGGAAQGIELRDVELTPSERYEASIFLSNFAEQGFNDYPGREQNRVMKQVDFAHRYCKINMQSAIEYRQENGSAFETVSLTEVNALLDRFFGEELTDETAARGYALAEWGFYRDGRFWYPAADGEAYNTFAITSSMAEVYDHVFYVNFTIYALDVETYFQEGISRAYYEMTPEEAASSPALEITGFGAALVTPYVMDGRSTYRLLEYRRW